MYISFAILSFLGKMAAIFPVTLKFAPFSLKGSQLGVGIIFAYFAFDIGVRSFWVNGDKSLFSG
jgi:hypothetical protein